MTPILWDNKWKIVIFGGISFQGDILNDIWIFDVKSNLFEEVIINSSSDVKPRYAHSATKVDDKIVIFAGCTSDKKPNNMDPLPGENKYLNDVLVLSGTVEDTSTGSTKIKITFEPYELTGEVAHPRCGHTATFFTFIKYDFYYWW